MGQQPAARVNEAFHFVHTGVDYAGPFELKRGNPRRPTITKCWLAMFVCLATKLVHIEVVSSASTEAFVAALKRFASRKGRAKHIYSDHGTNFVGARNQLKKFYDYLGHLRFPLDSDNPVAPHPRKGTSLRSHLGGSGEAG